MLIGIIGGMGPESTKLYEDGLNAGVKQRLGGLNNAEMMVCYVNLGEIKNYIEANQWDLVSKKIIEAAKRLKAAGADFVLMASNTPHVIAADIEDALDDTPFIHIVDETAKAVKEAGLKKVSLLGTQFTMENGFFADRLHQYGIEAITPSSLDVRKEIERLTFSELEFGVIKPSTKQYFLDAAQSLIDQGAEGIICGCTEFSMVIKPDDFKHVFDTARIHVDAALNRAYPIVPGNQHILK